MFSSISKDKKNTTSASALSATPDKDGAQTTVIAKGTTIEGKFSCTDNVRLDGAIHGEVHVDKRFVMGEGSHVKGNIHTRDATIRGKVNGDLFVKEALHLLESAVIEGNITAKTMIVDEGARYNGSCKIGDSATSAKN